MNKRKDNSAYNHKQKPEMVAVSRSCENNRRQGATHTASQQKTQKRGPPRTVYYRGSYDPKLLRCMNVVSTGKTAVAIDGTDSSY